MAELKSLGKVIEVDVLVVGHGCAGLAAAITAKETDKNLRVLAVDKGSLGYGGKANKGGGHCAFIPEGGEEAYVEYHTRNLGDYLNDQDLLRLYANSTRDILADVARWGTKIYGQEAPFNAHPMIPWKVVTVDLDFMLGHAKVAQSLGVKFMDKVSVVDLLTDGGKVVGAIGFSLLDGTTYLFKAKAVVLANGCQNWRIMRMWASGRGDGIAAAYRAGAKMRSAEFGSFIAMVNLETGHVSYGAEDALVNAKGVSLSEAARPFAQENPNLGVLGGVDLGGNHALFMYQDVLQGNGPIYEDQRQNYFVHSPIARNLAPEIGRADPPWYRPFAEKFWHTLYGKKEKGYRSDSPLKETVPGLIGEFSPLWVSHEMACSLPGLFAAGDIAGNGGSFFGAVPSPPGRNRGTGMMAAWFMARIAGPSAARYAAGTGEGAIDAAQAEALKRETFAPLERASGMTTQDMVWRIQNVMQPVKYTAWKHEERLKEALGKILDLKAMLPTLVAADWHYVSTVNECRSMLLASEMFFRACIERKESRGWFLREDFKQRDDRNWLKWIFLEKSGDEMAVSTEDVPMGSYRYHPGDKVSPPAPLGPRPGGPPPGGH